MWSSFVFRRFDRGICQLKALRNSAKPSNVSKRRVAALALTLLASMEQAQRGHITDRDKMRRLAAKFGIADELNVARNRTIIDRSA
jgi:hypothetical protein